MLSAIGSGIDRLDTFIALAIVKPLVLLVFVFFFAVATWLVKRFAAPWLKQLLLRKLW